MRQSILIFCISVFALLSTTISSVSAKEITSKNNTSVITEHNYTVTRYRGRHGHRGRHLRRAIRRAVRRTHRARRCHRHYSRRWGRIRHCHRRYRHHRHGRRHYR